MLGGGSPVLPTSIIIPTCQIMKEKIYQMEIETIENGISYY